MDEVPDRIGTGHSTEACAEQCAFRAGWNHGSPARKRRQLGGHHRVHGGAAGSSNVQGSGARTTQDREQWISGVRCDSPLQPGRIMTSMRDRLVMLLQHPFAPVLPWVGIALGLLLFLLAV